MFKKEDRSTFRYWFAHWCAYQMTALNLGVWKFKYLFHDIEKPFMLYWYMWICKLNHTDAYKKVQKWHREHNKHHIEYKGKNKDYYAMVIDWECSRFTKETSPLTANEKLERKMSCLNRSGLGDKDIFELKHVLFQLKLIKN